MFKKKYFLVKPNICLEGLVLDKKAIYILKFLLVFDVY
jgi:hypothetical protein